MVLLHTAAGVTVAVLSSGLVAVGVGTLHHADVTPTSRTQVADAQPRRCHAALEKLPAQLRQDLAAARKQPAGDRRPALRGIREKALHGDYGTPAQRWSERRIYRHARLAAHLPQQLRHDLKAVRKLPDDQRRAERQGIRDRVLDGAYGDAAQHALQKRKQHRAACVAQRS